jgi:hypothetical protein
MKRQAVRSATIALVVLLCVPASAQWVKTTGPTGASLTVLGTNLIATTTDGFFLTTDNGDTWAQVSSGLKRIRAFAVVGTNILASNEEGVYLSTNTGTAWTPVSSGWTRREYVNALYANGTNIFLGTYRGQVILSTDNGTSWTQKTSGSVWSRNSVEAFLLSGAYLFAGISSNGGGLSHGVFRSTDNGGSWSQAGLQPTNVYSFAANGTYLFAGTDSSIYRSSDNGTSWIMASSGLPTSSRVKSLVVKGTRLFAGTYGAGIFCTTDNGTTWSATNCGLTDQRVSTILAHGCSLFAGTESGVFLSTNNGSSWISMSSDLNPSVQALVATCSNLFAGTNGMGVLISTNNGTDWNAANTGLTNLRVYGLCPGDAGLYAAASFGGVFLSTDNGATWRPFNDGLTHAYTTAVATHGTYVFAATFAVFDGDDVSFLYSSSNGGTSWTRRRSVGFTSSVTPYVCDAYLFLTEAGDEQATTLRSNDNATSWSVVSTGLPLGPYFLSFGAMGSTLFATVFQVSGPPFVLKGVYRSTNNGDSWSPSGFANEGAYGFAFWGPYVFTVHEGSIFTSTDEGQNWSELNPALAGISNYGIQVAGEYLFASAASDGIWRLKLSEIGVPVTLLSFSAAPISPNGGVMIRWKTMSEINNYGFVVERDTAGAERSFAALAGSFTPGHGTSQVPHEYAYVDENAKRGRWIYRLRQMDLDGTIHLYETKIVDLATTAVADGSGLPGETSLAQNYPNPFNPTTRIRYTIARVVALSGSEGPAAGSEVRLVVYDLLGREVAVLVDEMKEPGSYEVRFDGSGLASGVYIYLLKAGSFVESKKLLLLR